MKRGMDAGQGLHGQTTTETILLLPFYLLMVFGILQMGQLATALLVVNYAASSIARQAVQDGSCNEGSGEMRLGSLLTAGMKKPKVNCSTPGTQLLSNVTVQACAEVSAFPFVAQFLSRPMRSYNGACGAPNTMGPFSLSGSNFIVHGKATARMNYRP